MALITFCRISHWQDALDDFSKGSPTLTLSWNSGLQSKRKDTRSYQNLGSYFYMNKTGSQILHFLFAILYCFSKSYLRRKISLSTVCLCLRDSPMGSETLNPDQRSEDRASWGGRSLEGGERNPDKGSSRFPELVLLSRVNPCNQKHAAHGDQAATQPNARVTQRPC